jgi:hypothetical protein
MAAVHLPFFIATIDVESGIGFAFKEVRRYGPLELQLNKRWPPYRPQGT